MRKRRRDSGWWKKPVAFNLDDPEDRELAEFARGMDNFTAAVKRWLRTLRQTNAAEESRGANIGNVAPRDDSVAGPDDDQFLL